jgi:NAD dependent epimerase/dehydratase family enzyme
LRLGWGDFADVLLASQRVSPAAAQAAGYRFQFPDLDAALAQILHRPTTLTER